MKKDRNSFFSQYGYNAYNQAQPMMPQNMNNYQSGYQSFSSGYNNGYSPETDLDSRLSRLEREIKLLDSRLSKLESGSTPSTTTNNDFNFANSMYMV